MREFQSKSNNCNHKTYVPQYIEVWKLDGKLEIQDLIQKKPTLRSVQQMLGFQSKKVVGNGETRTMEFPLIWTWMEMKWI